VKVYWIPLAVLMLALLWHQVFAMTGLLWWDAPAATAKLPRPAAPHLTPAPTDWVDVDTYLRTHPVWVP
jgi:hypothetical protein